MTAQITEYVIVDAQERLLQLIPGIPDSHPDIEEVDDDTAFNDCITALSTACRRRYIGTWEIRDGHLFLVRLRGKFSIRNKQPILAHWFSGTLPIPQGKMLADVELGFDAVYERELHVRIINGQVIDSIVVDTSNK